MSRSAPALFALLSGVVLVACDDPNPSTPADAAVAADAALGDSAVVTDGPMSMPGPPPTVAASYEHTCALNAQGAVKCWGNGGNYGQLGLEDLVTRGDQPNEMGAALPAVNLGSGLEAIQIAAGGSRTCALLEDHTVKCWGINEEGQLGLGHIEYRGDRPGTMGGALERVSLGTGRTAIAIAMGNDHTCALLDNHSVKCWGGNGRGQLGLGDRNVRGATLAQMGNNLPAVPLGTGRTAKAIGAGGGFSCALLDNNRVKCWGRNELGQLGLGDTDDRGDETGEMGDALPPIDFGTGRTVVALDADLAHTCAILDDGSVKCWGDNISGELGTGPTGRRGDQPGEMGDSWPAVPLGTGRTATAVSIGDMHSCAVLDTKQVKCWGYNGYGNLGLGNTTPRVDVADLGDALPTLDLGVGRSVISLVSGPYHVCAVLDNNAVKCWGRGNRDGTAGGWLGQGDLAHRGDDPNEMADVLLPIMLW